MDPASELLVCETEWSTRLSRWIVAPVFLLVALLLVSSGLTDQGPPAERLFVWAWVATAVLVGVSVFGRSVTRIEVDTAGVCTFRAPLRAVASCTLADVSDISMPVNGRTLRLRASGRKVAVVLPMTGVAAFLFRVKAVHGQDLPALEESGETLACRTDGRARRFQVIVWAVVASVVLWSWSNAAHGMFFRLFELAWVGFVAWILWTTFARKVILIEVDEAGSCTFRARTRVVVACSLADVSEIRLLGDGRTLRLRAAGRTVSALLPMDGIERFVSRARGANPGLVVDGF